MNKITILLLIIIMALCIVLGTALPGKAQDSRGFAGVIPFVTSSDRVGFFDQNTGIVYMYDNNISNCLYIGQISTLGDPVKVITAAPSKYSNQ